MTLLVVSTFVFAAAADDRGAYIQNLSRHVTTAEHTRSSQTQRFALSLSLFRSRATLCWPCAVRMRQLTRHDTAAATATAADARTHAIHPRKRQRRRQQRRRRSANYCVARRKNRSLSVEPKAGQHRNLATETGRRKHTSSARSERNNVVIRRRVCAHTRLYTLADVFVSQAQRARARLRVSKWVVVCVVSQIKRYRRTPPRGQLLVLDRSRPRRKKNPFSLTTTATRLPGFLHAKAHKHSKITRAPHAHTAASGRARTSPFFHDYDDGRVGFAIRSLVQHTHTRVRTPACGRATKMVASQLA